MNVLYIHLMLTNRKSKKRFIQIVLKNQREINLIIIRRSAIFRGSIIELALGRYSNNNKKMTGIHTKQIWGCYNINMLR